MIEHIEEYTRPDIYDQESPTFEPEGPLYLALAQRIGGSVLEIGCGTGRVTIPLAQQGIDITGLDISPHMLAQAKNKAGNLPIRWIEADACTFQLGKQFRFIFESGFTFLHLLTRADQEALLARVYEHLEPAGYFLISAYIPNSGFIENIDQEQEWYSYVNDNGNEIRVTRMQHYHPITQVRTETLHRRWQDEYGNEIVWRSSLKWRNIFPQELEMLLEYNHFVIAERYGDWDFSPLNESSGFLIYLCQKAKRA